MINNSERQYFDSFSKIKISIHQKAYIIKKTPKDGSRYWGVFAHQANGTLGLVINIGSLMASQNR